MPPEEALQPDNTTVLEIEFESTAEDVVAFNVYHHVNSPSIRKVHQRILLAYLLMGLALCLMITLDPKELVSLSIIALIFIGVGVFFWSRIYQRWRVKQQVRNMLREGNNRSLLGRQKIAINEASIVKTGTCDIIQTNWIGVDKIVTSDNYAFIYLSAITAHIVPKRAFARDADFNRFVQQARQFHEQAGAQPAQTRSG